jgi:hypothetical protein
VVRTHVLVHAERRERSLIGNSELRSLTPSDRAHVVERRRRYAETVHQIIADGVAQDVFRSDQPRAAGRAILSMSTAVSQWFDPAGPQSAEEIADQYAALALTMLNHYLAARTADGATG